MDDPKRKRIKSLAWLIPIVVIVGITAFILRGPHVSNALKKLILPELELIVGRKVIAQKIYVNLFPLFVEAKGLKIFDDSGGRILVSQRVKAYLDLTGIAGRNIRIRRRLIIGSREIRSKTFKRSC